VEKGRRGAAAPLNPSAEGGERRGREDQEGGEGDQESAGAGIRGGGRDEGQSTPPNCTMHPESPYSKAGPDGRGMGRKTQKELQPRNLGTMAHFFSEA